MNAATVSHIDIHRLGELVLTDLFDTSEVSGLTSREREKAYNRMKNEVRKSARSLEEYENNIKRIADFLQI